MKLYISYDKFPIGYTFKAYEILPDGSLGDIVCKNTFSGYSLRECKKRFNELLNYIQY